MPYFCWLIQFKVNQDKRCKVHIFWEGHKILWNLHLKFDWNYVGQIYSLHINSTFFFWFFSMLYKVWAYYNFIINHTLKQIKDIGDCKLVIDRCFRLVSKLFIDYNTFLDTLYIALAATSRALGSRLTGYNGFNLNLISEGVFLIRIIFIYFLANVCYVITVKLGNKEQIGIKEPFPVTNLPFTS